MQKNVLKRKMKEQLPENSRLSSKGVIVMNQILSTIFLNIMAEVKKEPYKDFSDYLIYRHGHKYLKTTGEAYRKLKFLRDDLTVFLDNAESEEKKEGGVAND